MCLDSMIEELHALDVESLTATEVTGLLVSVTRLREAAEAVQIRAMLRHVTWRNRTAFGEAVEMLLEQIAPLDTDDTNKAMSFWARYADADGREPRSVDGNSLSLTRTF